MALAVLVSNQERQNSLTAVLDLKRGLLTLAFDIYDDTTDFRLASVSKRFNLPKFSNVQIFVVKY